MRKLTINHVDYKIKFGYNCFCDTDLMDRVSTLITLFKAESVSNDKEASGLGQIKELFIVTRDLLFVGFRKYNPLESVQEVGDLLDEYIDEETEEERGLMQIFTMLSDELFDSGFLSGLGRQRMKNGVKAPQDHLSSGK